MSSPLCSSPTPAGTRRVEGLFYSQRQAHETRKKSKRDGAPAKSLLPSIDTGRPAARLGQGRRGGEAFENCARDFPVKGA